MLSQVVELIESKSRFMQVNAVATGVKELQKDAAPEAVHRIHHRSPARKLVSRVNTRHERIPHGLLRNRRRFCDNHRGAGPLRVVNDRRWRRDAVASGAIACHRRHQQSMRQCVRSEPT